ncbi:hypothetical protein N658DRAFT_519244 [Parathielavia hyrcaniae]|uniref:DUF7600 domain-containing protein n=1 Tax=Parathielavia hyrcaniae TaxID=113614 RepID=A0AAN6PTH8_9PEZI|nr:hypothetical protein N658DRAFT_519244 [Parathielavia hyrcaniae]
MYPSLVRCGLCGWAVFADWGSEEGDAVSEPQWEGQFRARRHGIIFHDACWSLLEAALEPGPVPLQRLFDVCSSLPVPQNCRTPTWGHDFGRAVVVDETNHFPWEDRYEVSESTLAKPHPAFGTNPYQQPPASTQHPSPPTLALDSIAVLLPTADVLRARLASRAFWPIFDSQQFWASRFRGPLPAADRDWRWLYRRTTDNYLGPGLRNRRRIWALVQMVVYILALVWNESSPSLTGTRPLDPALSDTGYRVEVNGLLLSPSRPDDHQFRNGCRVFRNLSIAVPSPLAQLSVYTFAFGDGKYVTGMSLITADRDNACLGYSSRSVNSIDLTQLWGFRVAMGSRGLQALQCITEPADQNSSWFKSLDDVPRSERLVLTDSVVGLELGLDACKIASLALDTQSPPSQLCSGLRDSAVWYPSIPPQELCLNEESFLPRDWPAGKYLRHLTGIQAASCGSILRIHFSFDTEVPWEHQYFGRVKTEEEDEHHTDFPIDGPGGERIETIKMRHYYHSAEVDDVGISAIGVITEEKREDD